MIFNMPKNNSDVNSKGLIKSGQIHNKEELIQYLSKKGNNHHNYRFYSKRERIETILKDHTIYLSDGSNWNDTIDRENFNDNPKEYKRFGLCFSFSKSESVAMWMLYSQNDGCMIDYGQNLIKEILQTNTVQLGEFKNNVFQPKKIIERPQFKISLFDIVYYGESKKDNSGYYVKRADEVHKSFNKEIIDELSYQKKFVPWRYENECRLVVEVKSDICDFDEISCAAIEFNENYIDKLKERTYDSPNSKSEKYNRSELRGQINWNLCSECKKIYSKKRYRVIEKEPLRI